MIKSYPFNYLSNKYYQWAASTIVIFLTGWKYFLSFFHELFIMKEPGMYTLIFMATLLSYGYGIFLIFRNFNNYELTFESGTIIITVLLIGDTISAVLNKKISNNIKNTLSLENKKANLVNNNFENEKLIEIINLKIGDIVLIKKGEKIPSDGKIIKKNALLDESMLTGEANYVQKTMNDNVYGGTVNVGDYFYVQIDKEIDKTLMSEIANKVNEIKHQKSKIGKIADRIAMLFIPFVIILAVLGFLLQYYIFEKQNVAFAINTFVSVIIIACPCALGLATPLALAIGISKATKYGIIFNNVDVFDKINKINAIAFDKTGTITTGKLMVSKIYGTNQNNALIYNIEKFSNHPIAKSITKFLELEKNIEPINFDDYNEILGEGVIAKIKNNTYRIIAFKDDDFDELINFNEKTKNELTEDMKKNNVFIAFYVNNSIENVILLSDEIRLDAVKTIEKLNLKKIESFMITGDNDKNAKKIAAILGIKNFYANVLPIQKSEIVKTIQAQNKIVAYVGDGLNDIVALQQSDLAISMNNNSSAITNSSDITIVKEQLFSIYQALICVKLTRKIMISNFLWAFGYNIVALSLAMFGIIPPMFSAIAMGLSNITVLLNSLIFNALKIKF
ncbi:heavy metal translocating P-type ATPase [Spiroplasma endosymbiont of Labia minor]|uniref:heavy metal translocating P-type ATPase n=1 Tax=Spiroplasma endosymbiont of Labia minor TaxID=3066305 RepID=UPI003BAF135C